MQTQIFDTANYLFQQTAKSTSILGPVLTSVILGLFVFVAGLIIAKIIRNITRKFLSSINFSKWLSKTPLQLAFEESNVGNQVEDVLANIVYWIIILLMIHTTINIFGLYSLANILNNIIAYIPRILTASLILMMGVLLAGWIEGLVKGLVKNIDVGSSILLGKISSYIVVVTAILLALAELGIATEFITILFLGFIGSISLAVALAFGLGGKEVVSKILMDWYSSNFNQKNKKLSKKINHLKKTQAK